MKPIRPGELSLPVYAPGADPDQDSYRFGNVAVPLGADPASRQAAQVRLWEQYDRTNGLHTRRPESIHVGRFTVASNAPRTASEATRSAIKTPNLSEPARRLLCEEYFPDLEEQRRGPTSNATNGGPMEFPDIKNSNPNYQECIGN